jgi:hypothetical protein
MIFFLLSWWPFFFVVVVVFHVYFILKPLFILYVAFLHFPLTLLLANTGDVLNIVVCTHSATWRLALYGL